MARMRTIKPETFISETLAEVSVHARWTFAGLWTYADDEGRGRADARLIKAAIWALDDDVTSREVAAFLDELEAESLICRYEAVDGKKYLHIVNFSEHQKPNRPVPSKLPECPKANHGGLSEDSVSAPAERRWDSRGIGRTLDCADLGALMGVTEQIGHNFHESAGQTSFTEDSLSTHGVVSQISFTNTPTPTPLRTEVDGDVVGVSEIGKSSTSLVTSEIEPDDPPEGPVRDDVERVCVHLADRIEANGSPRPRITKRWRDAARLLIDKNGRTEEQVHAAIDWCQDDTFWQANILSMPKLREKYDQMRLQAKNRQSRDSPKVSRSTTDERVAAAQALKQRFRAMPPTIAGEITQ